MEWGNVFYNLPSEFSITLALFPSITATQEFVVPRSIPIILNAHDKNRLNLWNKSNLRWEVSPG